MAQVNQRAWKVPGQRAKRKAWGFTAQISGRQVRRYKAEWTQDDAERELAAALLQVESEKPKDASITLAAAAERYLGLKARKRTIAEDRRALKHLKAAFGEATLLTDLTADRISKYKARRLATTRTIGGTEKPLSAAAVNRPLALLRHLLRLAHDEWGVLDRVPKIRIEKEPQGRLRWLTRGEATNLLAACRNDMRVAREEIFGPVIVVIPFDDDAEAVIIANDSDYGLYDYVYSGDSARAMRVVQQLRCGHVGINTAQRNLEAPFGGFKLSGIGRDGGDFGLHAYTEMQSIIWPG